jgi:DNA-binding MarR family transcriptional regulator
MSEELHSLIRELRIELRILNDRVAEAAGLNPRDLDVLDLIDRHGPCTPRHLERRTGIRAATLTGILVRLERDGWIARTVDPDDRRSARLASTPRFGELRALYGPGTDAVEQAAAELTPEARAAVTAFLTRVVSAARHAMPIPITTGEPQ